MKISHHFVEVGKKVCMAKTRKIKDSAFDSMEIIVKLLTNPELDQQSQLYFIKQVVYDWASMLKKIVNE